MAKTGFKKLIAVASDKGINEAAANINVTPHQPNIERKACNLRLGDLILVFLK